MNTSASAQGHTGSAGSAAAKTPAPQPTGEHAPADETPGPFRETRYGWLVLAAVWIACTIFMVLHLRQGLAAFDAGLLGEMAERVLRGQIPHRDFIEVYTGGLTYLNALAFRLFGVNYFSLRIPFFVCFLGWVPSVYFIARRFAAPLTTGVVTLLAVAWGPLNYPQGMASWYNLFFATWGVLALLRYTETEKSRWLWVAGLCGGLSFLVKVTGLYFVAAALLFFVFREHSLARANVARAGRGGIIYKLFVTASLALFLLSVVMLVSSRPVLGDFFLFVLPSACLVALLLWEEWRGAGDATGAGFGRLFRMLRPFLAGLLLPAAVFLGWYAREHALTDWIRGMFRGGSGQILYGGKDAVSPLGSVILLPVLLVAAMAFDSHASVRRFGRYCSPLLLGGLIVAAWRSVPAYIFIVYSLPFLVPLAALAALFAFRRTALVSGAGRQQAFAVVAAAFLCGIVQFPRPSAIYFCYFAPLLVLAFLALYSLRKGADKVVMGWVVAFYLGFIFLVHGPTQRGEVQLPGRQPVAMRLVRLDRAGGLRTPVAEAEFYENLVRVIRQRARGPYIYCTPDCPQVYFLSGKLNPTRTVLDFLDPDFMDIPYRTERILETLQSHGVNLVVLGNWKFQLAGQIPPTLRRALDARYPESRTIGQFEVRWKP